MAKEMDDGAIIESSIPTTQKPDEYIRFNEDKIYKAQIDEVIYTDDERNKNGTAVEYNLTLLSFKANNAYRKIFNAISLNSLGGFNDYSEIIYKPKTREIVRGNEQGKAYAENTDGDFVAVKFLEGNEQACVILGAWYHPRTNESSKKTKRATKSDGHRLKFEYNGMDIEINKDGELKIESLGGPRDTNGNLTNAGNGGILIKLSKDGKITLDTQDQAKITVDKNSNEVEIEANTIKLGNSAIEPIILGNQWLAYNNAQIVATLNALISVVGAMATSLDTHTHSYTWTGSAGSGNTGGPSTPSSPAAPSPAAAATPTLLAKKGKSE